MLSLEELKSQSGLDDLVFKGVIEALIDGEEIIQQGPLILIRGFEIEFTSDQQKRIKGLLGKFFSNPTLPPSVGECREEVGDEVYTALLSLGTLKQISPGVVFDPGTYQKMVDDLIEKLVEDGTITVADARDHFGSSRKYMLAFLEKLDAATMKGKNDYVVAMDAVGAGIGEVVFYVSGSSARMTEVTQNKPADATITAIVDNIEKDGQYLYQKTPEVQE